MQIAIVSDIHANLAAWHAVLADISARSVDKIICLGDIVGYGPQPAEVLSSVYAHADFFVLGNHDAVVGGLMEPEGFNPMAGKLIDHTRMLLGKRAENFFARVPLSLRHNHFRFAHGSAAAPEKFTYVIGQREAMDLWNSSESAVTCVGHTHVPRLHVLAPDGRYRRFKAPEKTVTLKKDYRYIINCGSVGLPRDDDLRASYATLDTHAWTVHWHRVPYDMQAFRTAVHQTYSDPELSAFLLGKIDRKVRRPVRELTDFTPGRSKVSDAVTGEKDLRSVKKRMRLWRLAAVSAFLIILPLLAGSAFLWQSLPQTHTIEATADQYLHVQALGGGWVYDYMSEENPPPHPLPETWSAGLSDRRRQQVRLGDGMLNISSESIRPVTVSLQPAMLADTGRVRWEIEGTAGRGWEGHPPLLVVDFAGEDGFRREGAERIALRREDDRLFRTSTISVPAGATILRAHIHFESAGPVSIDTLRAVFMPTEQKLLLLEAPHDLNSISARELEAIPGIGRTLAARIVEHRDDAGGFERVEDLLDIPGIGESLLAEINIYVEVPH